MAQNLFELSSMKILRVTTWCVPAHAIGRASTNQRRAFTPSTLNFCLSSLKKALFFWRFFFSIEIREKNEIVEIWPPRRRRHRSRTCWRRVWRRLVGFVGKGFFQVRFFNFSIENHRLFWVFETHLYSLCYIQSNAIISDTDYNVVFRQKVGFKFCQLCSIIT